MDGPSVINTSTSTAANSTTSTSTSTPSTSKPFQPFAPPQSIRSLSLLSEHTLPSLQELVQLEQELVGLKTKSVARAKRAEVDLNAFEVMYRKAKDREKVKAKIKIKEKSAEGKETVLGVKIKQEFRGTPDVDEGSVPSTSARPVTNGMRKPNPSAAKAAFNASLPPAGPAPHGKAAKLKNKRKRLEESEDDAESTTSDLMPPPSQRARPSPLPHSVHPSPVASKAKSGSHAKGTLSASASVASLQGMAGGGAQPPPSAGYAPTPQYGSGPVGVVTDWSLPPRPALPVKPVGAALGGFTYSKTPTDPKEVMEDFSDRKAPSAQIPIHTFWKEVESWMKPVGEEDVAWLEFDADDVEPFLTPSLGRHYTEVWKEEDRLAEIAAAAAAQTWPRGYSLDRTYKVEENGVGASQGGFGDIRKEDAEWDPRTIEGEELLREDKGLGPVTERLVSALLLDEGQALGRMGKEEDGGMKGKVGAGVTGVGEMESRIRVELRALGLLSEEEPNFENPVDDEITSTLRRCQALLGRQRKVNLARKNRLLSIARDRLAYQDYVNTLEGLEKSITAGFTKMLKARAPKKKKESKVPNGGGSEEVASGLGGKVVLEVSEGLTEKVLLRERWVDLFGRAMAEWDEREEGRLTGLPEKSIYEGIEEVGGE